MRNLFIYLIFLFIAIIKPENYKSAIENDWVMLPCGRFPIRLGVHKVSWERNGHLVTSIDSNRFSTIENNGSMIINSVSRGDEGWYTCVIVSTEHGITTTRKVNMFLGVMCKFGLSFF